ncbi:hypothetical protein RUM44_008624 [Polyplax serrata]|uniref:Uncharacterized protein n=1 Tax=Polyplax serrata TaxID=468196 RepID=A0ABR1B8T0_POLSC
MLEAWNSGKIPKPMQSEEPKGLIRRCSDLLKVLPPQTKIFDIPSSSESDSSELSGPFSTVVFSDVVESKRRAKKLFGKDLYTAFNFSMEFKTAIKEVKEKMAEDSRQKSVSESAAEVSVEAVEEIEAGDLDDSGLENVRSSTSRESEETPFDTMSGYWRMLSVYDTFRISAPWFDAYAEGKSHWLQTQPIPQEVLENSRQKCLNWLAENFDD